MSQTVRPRVALIVETSLASGREVLRGIARFMREQGPWSAYLEPRGLEQDVPRWLKNWDGDGIIARVQNAEIAEAVAGVKVPTVDVLGVVEGTGFPLVHVDDEAIGVRAAEHLLERGFQQFGFVGFEGENWSTRRGRSFAKRLAVEGRSCETLEVSRRTAFGGPWDQFEDELSLWAKDLRRPVGVMLASDQLGPEFLRACRRAGADVPEDVGVIGVDNDEPLCLVSDPTLSSLNPDHAQVGHEAAALLQRMINGEGLQRGALLLPPGEVITRGSTQVLAVDDRELAAAVRFVRERACEGISVEDVVAHAKVCRTILQRRFKNAFGHTIHDEIIQARLERARDLLRHTDVPLPEIAVKAGFRHQEYLGAVFKARLGTTPGQFRKEARARPPMALLGPPPP